jgi:hypothetical protein
MKHLRAPGGHRPADSGGGLARLGPGGRAGAAGQTPFEGRASLRDGGCQAQAYTKVQTARADRNWLVRLVSAGSCSARSPCVVGRAIAELRVGPPVQWPSGHVTPFFRRKHRERRHFSHGSNMASWVGRAAGRPGA